MNSLTRFSCLVFVLVAVLRCETGGSSPLESPGILMATIHGSVSNGGSPINDAVVSLSGLGITRTASSGSNGFTFADLPPGIYTLSVVHPGLTCESATAETKAGETVTASIACVEQLDSSHLGTIAGTVTAGGAPIPGALVLVVDHSGARLTGADGAFTFDLAPGAYTVFATAAGTMCESASIMVEVDQTVRADIVCGETGRLQGRLRWPNNASIVDAKVTLSGPISREVRTGSQGFVFDDLPPGDYTVTAATGVGCQSVTATVQGGQVTNIAITCEFFGGSEIAGNWFMSLPRVDDFGEVLYSQEGDCPPLLPAEGALGSIAFDSASGTISIEGLDPDLTFAGSLEADCEDCGHLMTRRFSGTGSAVRADGSAIRSELIGNFSFNPNGRSSLYAGMTRTHLDPGGSSVCTETYWVEGSKR